MSDPIAQIDQRVRAVENEQAAHRATLVHINDTLGDLRALLQTSVQLQEKQVTHSEAIERAFAAIEEAEDRIDDLESIADRFRGALWITNGAWALSVAAVGVALKVWG